jgi:hypothetical protein
MARDGLGPAFVAQGSPIGRGPLKDAAQKAPEEILAWIAFDPADLGAVLHQTKVGVKRGGEASVIPSGTGSCNLHPHERRGLSLGRDGYSPPTSSVQRRHQTQPGSSNIRRIISARAGPGAASSALAATARPAIMYSIDTLKLCNLI